MIIGIAMLKWEITFANPFFLGLFIVIPFLIAHYILRWKKNKPSLLVSDTSYYARLPKTLRQRTHFLPLILRLAAISLIIVALARPQGNIGYEEISKEGIDIVLAFDMSSSMYAKDFKPNRLEASKEIMKEFVQQRENDRFGLVVFAGESVTRSPLTTDRTRLIQRIDDIKIGQIPDGTAIGLGLATAVNRIKDSEASSKVIILLTDGVNNAGEVSPSTAGQIAKTFGIRVYSIGVGTTGMAPTPVSMLPNGQFIYENMPVKIDEDLLKGISATTGGKYFRANNENKLRAIYDEIDQLEKTKIQVTQYENKPDKYWMFVLIASILLLLELLLRSFVYRIIP